MDSGNFVSRCQTKGYGISSNDYKVVDLRDANWYLPMQRSLKEQEEKAKAMATIAKDNATVEEELQDQSKSTKGNSKDPKVHKITPLNVHMYDCGFPIPANKTLDGYSDLKTTDCSYCADVCEPPSIDGTVHFFDGFQTDQVMWTYAALLGFTVLWQLYICLIRRPRVTKEWEEIQGSKDSREAMLADRGVTAGAKPLNQTASSREVNQYKK